jgi:hypothetical protein
VFLATPFGGSDAASQAQWLVTVKGIMGEQSSDQLVRDLKEKHDFVRHRVQKFAEIANADSVRLPVWCFFETKKTKLLRKLLSRNLAAKLSSSSTNKIVGALFQCIIASIDKNSSWRSLLLAYTGFLGKDYMQPIRR